MNMWLNRWVAEQFLGTPVLVIRLQIVLPVTLALAQHMLILAVALIRIDLIGQVGVVLLLATVLLAEELLILQLFLVVAIILALALAILIPKLVAQVMVVHGMLLPTIVFIPIIRVAPALIVTNVLVAPL